MINLLKINNLVSEKNITKVDLSAKIGISYQGLNKIIKNNSTSTKMLEKIADSLQVPVSYFFDESDISSSKFCPNCEKYRRELELAYKYIRTLEEGCGKKGRLMYVCYRKTDG